MQEVGNISKIYKSIVDYLIDNNASIPMFLCKEDDIFNLALKHLKNKESALEFIMQLRCNSYAFKYNKVSIKADAAVRKILLSKGYYKKNQIKILLRKNLDTVQNDQTGKSDSFEKHLFSISMNKHPPA